jgi:exportin-7
LAAFYFNNIANITAGDNHPSPAALNLARHIGEFPSLFPQVCDANLLHHILKSYYVIITLFLQQILKTLFEIIIFEDAGNQWSLSRPILSLIMISEQVPA